MEIKQFTTSLFNQEKKMKKEYTTQDGFSISKENPYEAACADMAITMNTIEKLNLMQGTKIGLTITKTENRVITEALHSHTDTLIRRAQYGKELVQDETRREVVKMYEVRLKELTDNYTKLLERLNELGKKRARKHK